MEKAQTPFEPKAYLYYFSNSSPPNSLCHLFSRSHLVSLRLRGNPCRFSVAAIYGGSCLGATARVNMQPDRGFAKPPASAQFYPPPQPDWGFARPPESAHSSPSLF